MFIDTHTAEYFHVIELVVTQGNQQFDQQSIDGQLCELFLIKIVISHLRQDITDIMVDMRICGFGNFDGLLNKWLNRREPMYAGKRRHIKNVNKATSCFRCNNLM